VEYIVKILVTGAQGQLGTDIMTELKWRGIDTVGVDIAEMDILDGDSVRRVMEAEQPGAVIHCAAWTAVDLAEDAENRERVFGINATGTEHIAQACRNLGCKMAYISTDYVFSGQGERPWEPDDERQPLNAYGQSKYQGELAVERLLQKYFIIRTAWVFGASGKNFVKTMLRLGKTRSQISVVNDQIGTPTYTRDLARLAVDMVMSERYGAYHATNEGGYISWYGFACEIFHQAAAYDSAYAAVTASPVTSEQYPVKATRPHNSRLSKQKLEDNGFVPLPPWKDALARYLREMEM
jgi:dTDP-4-dehydrorhamnose reductase